MGKQCRTSHVIERTRRTEAYRRRGLRNWFHVTRGSIDGGFGDGRTVSTLWDQQGTRGARQRRRSTQQRCGSRGDEVLVPHFSARA